MQTFPYCTHAQYIEFIKLPTLRIKPMPTIFDLQNNHDKKIVTVIIVFTEIKNINHHNFHLDKNCFATLKNFFKM